MVVAVYPGAFDPLTRGHEDLIRRASKVFDTLIVGIAYKSRKKTPFLNVFEREEIARKILCQYKNVRIESFGSLLKDFVLKHDAQIIIRGLRAVSDFEYEFQMASINHYFLPDVETVFMTPSEGYYQMISSSIVREIAKFGGDISKFVHPLVHDLLEKKFKL